MTLPLFFPAVKYIPRVVSDSSITIEELCSRAGVRCEAMGAWTQRAIVLREAPDQQGWIRSEPGDWGCVELGVPGFDNPERVARWALGALAFVLFDGVARATVQGKKWAEIERRRGSTPLAKRPMTTAERQQRLRKKLLTSG